MTEVQPFSGINNTAHVVALLRYKNKSSFDGLNICLAWRRQEIIYTIFMENHPVK
jgi:hypothetical protein